MLLVSLVVSFPTLCNPPIGRGRNFHFTVCNPTPRAIGVKTGFEEGCCGVWRPSPDGRMQPMAKPEPGAYFNACDPPDREIDRLPPGAILVVAAAQSPTRTMRTQANRPPVTRSGRPGERRRDTKGTGKPTQDGQDQRKDKPVRARRAKGKSMVHQDFSP